MATSRRDFMKLAAVAAGATALAPVLASPAAAQPAAAASAASVRAVRPVTYRVGKWLASDQAQVDQWLTRLIAADAADPQPFHPVITEFQQLIESDPEIWMFFHQMFEELPKTPRFAKTPIGSPQVTNYRQMLRLMNRVLTIAPTYNATSFVGLPINVILSWPMGTEGGYAAFLNDRVNAQLKRVLNTWAEFLGSPASAYVLDDDPRHGWLGTDAMAAMPGFVADYNCDPTKPHYGFTTWDDFFTRTFRPGRRPLAAPDDGAIVANACESAPLRIARNVKEADLFWIKGQPYSLRHMLADDPVAPQFAGGTVYQAYLSALAYHRFHSPVTGTIVRAFVKDGSYYSNPPSLGWDDQAQDGAQAYLTEVATRGVVLIEADDPRIGLMAFIPVGMGEVSTVELTVKDGQRVTKGEQVGMFHFGGSTHVLVFRPGVKVAFDLHGQKPGHAAANVPINSRIATVR